MFSLAQTISQYSHTCILLLAYKCFWDTKYLMREILTSRVIERKGYCFSVLIKAPKGVSPTSPPNTGRKAISFTFAYDVHPFQESILISLPLMGCLL